MMALEDHSEGQFLSTLLDGIALIDQAGDRLVSGLSMDSRRVVAGDLFMACRGNTTSGSLYLNDAVAHGAVAAVVEAGDMPTGRRVRMPVIPVPDLSLKAGLIAARFYGLPSLQMRVTGVTGTNGKTSVSHYIAASLTGIKGRRAGLIGTLGYGTQGALAPALLTTPDAVTLQHTLAEMRNQEVLDVVMEVSSHALQQGRTRGIRFDTAVFTNLTRDHLDYHGNMEEYASAKRILFESEDLARAVINIDDPFGRKLHECMPAGVDVIAYRLVDEFAESAQFQCLEARLLDSSIGSLRLAVRGPWGAGEVHCRLTGKFNAYNVLATLAVLCVQDVPFAAALEAISHVRPVPGRMEAFGGGDRPIVVVDYAHTPDALEQALSVLRDTCRGRLLCVFGCGGDRDRGKRPEMGRLAQSLADRVVLTSDNPRSEPPDLIIDEIRAGMSSSVAVYVEPDRAAAIDLALNFAEAGDVVLVAGKGHETYQEITGTRYPFSDRELVRRLLEELP